MSGSGNPRIETPNDDPALHPNERPGCSFAERTNALVDHARQLVVDLGLRPYRVHSVRVRWTGGQIGRGEPKVIEEREFLPTPELREPSVRSEERSGGLVERGTLQLIRISPRYTEDEVRGLCQCGSLPKGEQGWIEVRVDARDGKTERRRFVVSGMPFRKADAFEWRANLVRQDEDRDRDGRPPNGLGSP